MREHSYFVYRLASRKNGTLYIGVTNNLERRLWEHRNAQTKTFVSKYAVLNLVYCENYPEIAAAIAREKAMKEWKRAWKIRLIEEANPNWNDLSADWF